MDDELKFYDCECPKQTLNEMKEREGLIARLVKEFYIAYEKYSMHSIYMYYEHLLEAYPDNRIADTVFNRLKKPSLDYRLIDNLTFERFLLKSSINKKSKLLLRYVYESRSTFTDYVTALDIEVSSCTITTKNLCWEVVNNLGLHSTEHIFKGLSPQSLCLRVFGISVKELIKDGAIFIPEED